MQAPASLPLTLLAALGLQGVLLAFSPTDRAVWAMETALALAMVLVVVALATFRGVRFLSAQAYVLLAAFLAMHLTGAHFTYTATPGPWDLESRNHFDRVVHFSAGLLLTPVLRELSLRVVPMEGFWSRAVPWSFLVSLAALFEVGEMAAARVAGGGTGAEYLGAQGDQFDPVWDIFLAALGGAIALCAGALLQQRHRMARAAS